MFCCMENDQIIHLPSSPASLSAAVQMQFSAISSTPAKCSPSGVKVTILNPMGLCLLSFRMHVVDTLSFMWHKRLTLAEKFNYWCKRREKGNNTGRRMTLYVDNLYIIDCHCSVVSVIHSVTLCGGSI